MIIMATADSVKAKLQGLIDKSNATTGNTDADLTTAVDALVAGYGKGGGGSLDGYFAVNFYNDDRTTLLYTVYVPSGSSAIYAGETPISTVSSSLTFGGFEPAAVNVTADMDCYAVYASFTSLNEATWEQISEASAKGMAENYFAVGDTKMIRVNGTIGSLTVNNDFGVYIIGFNHNRAIEGNGITFGTFKSALEGGKNIALNHTSGASGMYGDVLFNINHTGGYNGGGWAASDMRYDILGSTDVPPSPHNATKYDSAVGYDASVTCATDPVENTLMSALPADLRAVMKPMTIYTDNKGYSNGTEEAVTASVDYLPLLAEYEIFGKNSSANTFEKNKQAQYAYFSLGNSKTKYKHDATSTTANWWTRSVRKDDTNSWCFVYSGSAASGSVNSFQTIAPIFKV
jgi:hypothetical protein